MIGATDVAILLAVGVAVGLAIPAAVVFTLLLRDLRMLVRKGQETAEVAAELAQSMRGKGETIEATFVSLDRLNNAMSAVERLGGIAGTVVATLIPAIISFLEARARDSDQSSSEG